MQGLVVLENALYDNFDFYFSDGKDLNPFLSKLKVDNTRSTPLQHFVFEASFTDDDMRAASADELSRQLLVKLIEDAKMKLAKAIVGEGPILATIESVDYSPMGTNSYGEQEEATICKVDHPEMVRDGDVVIVVGETRRYENILAHKYGDTVYFDGKLGIGETFLIKTPAANFFGLHALFRPQEQAIRIQERTPARNLKLQLSYFLVLDDDDRRTQDSPDVVIAAPLVYYKIKALLSDESKFGGYFKTQLVGLEEVFIWEGIMFMQNEFVPKGRAYGLCTMDFTLQSNAIHLSSYSTPVGDIHIVRNIADGVEHKVRVEWDCNLYCKNVEQKVLYGIE